MKNTFRSNCPVASMLDIIGDKWSLLIVRDMILMHKKTFKEISRSDEKIAPSILSARLKLLEFYGIISRTKLPHNKKENIYLLTERGIDLAPIVIECALWGGTHLQTFNDIGTLDSTFATNKLHAIENIKNHYNAMTAQLMQ
ncbi:MAG: helix-turn-helix domain-containing protein [Bacteroidota bacterium]